ncbi:MAG: phosphodiester glycosidase family protein [Polyangia bacterium]
MRSVLIVLAMLVSASCHATPARCVSQQSSGRGFVVCTVDVRRDTLRLFDLDEHGTAFGSFDRLSAALASSGALAWAMNAGMYDEHGKPVGLYIDGGKQQKPVSTRDGPGNFHMKPNGIFFVEDGKVAVRETGAYLAQSHHATLATQSGPMLLVDGNIHPGIMSTGTSRKLRNGVGVRDEHTAVFVISDDPVTFWELATLFRDTLGCKNALFLDGTVASLYAPELHRKDDAFPLGPILGIVERPSR